MLYSTLIIEINYIYLYVAFAVSTTAAYILVQKYHFEHSKTRKILSYISYLIAVFVVTLALFLIFLNKYNAYFDFFTLYISKGKL